jgi:hypothetical protein
VGSPVGWPVGSPVGWPVGSPVGWPVGSPVGWPVGSPVGARVVTVSVRCIQFMRSSSSDRIFIVFISLLLFPFL